MDIDRLFKAASGGRAHLIAVVWRVALVSILMLTLIMTGPSATRADNHGVAAPDVAIYVNSQQLTLDVAPRIVDGRTLVPFRAIFERLDAEVAWDEQARVVTAIKNDLTLRLDVDAGTVTLNGESLAVDVPPRIVDGRTLVPLRLVSEALGASVHWDGDTRTVLIRQDMIWQRDSLTDQPRMANLILSGRAAGYQPATTDWRDSDVPVPPGREASPGAVLRQLVEQQAMEEALGLDAWEVTKRIYLHDETRAEGIIMAWGFGDDAVAGQDYLVVMERNEAGWFAVSIRERNHCFRAVDEEQDLCI